MRGIWILLLTAFASLAADEIRDWRKITSGLEIPNEGYADQPYVVKAADGAWLVVITTGTGIEGAGGRHMTSARSTDKRRRGPRLWM